MREANQARRKRWLVTGLAGVAVMTALAVTFAVAQSPAPPITPEGYPDNRYPQPNQVGAFDYTEMGTFQPKPEDMTFDKEYYGMPKREIWFDSELRDAATGNKYKLTSTVILASDTGALSSRNWLPLSLMSSPTGLVPNPTPKSWTGGAQPPVETITPDGKLRYTVNNTVTTETIEFDEETFSWKSGNGDIDLRGTLVTPGTQWLLPWRTPAGVADMWLYLSHNYSIEGTYYGEQVNGYMLMEQRWGNGFYGNTWNVRNRIGGIGWFATEYKDGTAESGWWLCGEYGSRGAAFANDQGEEILNTQDLNVSLKGDGNSWEMTTGEGQRWEFVDDPEASLGGIRTGVMKRHSEKRKIVRAHALYISRKVPSDGSICRAEDLSPGGQNK